MIELSVAKPEIPPAVRSMLLDEARRYLASYGVPVEFLSLVGHAYHRIVECIQDRGYDLLFIGAYGHSRLGESVFGGVTHDLLHKSPVCCLFSH